MTAWRLPADCLMTARWLLGATLHQSEDCLKTLWPWHLVAWRLLEIAWRLPDYYLTVAYKPQASRMPWTVFYTFVGSWIISVSRPLGNEINQGPYYVKFLTAFWQLYYGCLTTVRHLKICPLKYDYQLIDLAKLITIVITIGYAKAAREGVGCFPEGNVEFNHDDCSSFLMCNHQRYIKMLCPKMLRFDPTTKTCNLIDRVRICLI